MYTDSFKLNILEKQTTRRLASALFVCNYCKCKPSGTSSSTGINTGELHPTPSPPPTRLLRCGRCEDAFYCNEACQRADWKFHKTRCVPK